MFYSHFTCTAGSNRHFQSPGQKTAQDEILAHVHTLQQPIWQARNLFSNPYFAQFIAGTWIQNSQTPDMSSNLQAPGLSGLSLSASAAETAQRARHLIIFVDFSPPIPCVFYHFTWAPVHLCFCFSFSQNLPAYLRELWTPTLELWIQQGGRDTWKMVQYRSSFVHLAHSVRT